MNLMWEKKKRPSQRFKNIKASEIYISAPTSTATEGRPNTKTKREQ